MNKKAQSTNLLNLSFVILAVFMGLLITMFTNVMLFETIGQEALERIYNVSVDLNAQGTIGNATLAHEAQILSDYKSINWFPDLFSFWILATSFILSLIAAYKSRSEGWMSFFGWLTIGSYIFLLIANFVFQFGQWFWGQYFEKLFYDLSYSLAFTTWFVANGQVIMFIWFVMLVFANKFKFSNTKKDEGNFIEDIPDEEVLIEE